MCSSNSSRLGTISDSVCGISVATFGSAFAVLVKGMAIFEVDFVDVAFAGTFAVLFATEMGVEEER